MQVYFASEYETNFALIRHFIKTRLVAEGHMEQWEQSGGFFKRLVQGSKN